LLVKRNRGFLRALVHHDSETRREEVLEKRVEFERGNPGTKFYTLFDYTERRVPIGIVPLTEPEDTLEVVRIGRVKAVWSFTLRLLRGVGGSRRPPPPPMRSSGANVPDGETLVRIHT
jgi:hypothetical protein